MLAGAVFVVRIDPLTLFVCVTSEHSETCRWLQSGSIKIRYQKSTFCEWTMIIIDGNIPLR